MQLQLNTIFFSRLNCNISQEVEMEMGVDAGRRHLLSFKALLFNEAIYSDLRHLTTVPSNDTGWN
jgi:hypothetical protein